MSGKAERIAAAAIRVDGEVWTLPRPARHCHLVNAWSAAHWREGQPARIGPHEQGFVTTAGQFVDRTVAAGVAYEAGQIETARPQLYSEDLW